MKPRKYIQLGIFLCLFAGVDANWGFVSPQSSCKITCENGGVCAYEINNHDIHRCICLINMFEGEFCQYKVTSTTTPQELPIATDAATYDVEDFREATPDMHYSEFDESKKTDNQSPSSTDNTQVDDYAEFEPHHTDEIYHEAAIAPSDSSPEPLFSETHTIRGETTEANTYYQDRKTEKPKEIEGEEDDEFYEDDSSWMMFKRRAVNGECRQHFTQMTYLAVFLAFTIPICFKFILEF